jgi:hypothetical protein
MADIARSAGSVLHHERVAELILEPLSQDADETGGHSPPCMSRKEHCEG